MNVPRPARSRRPAARRGSGRRRPSARRPPTQELRPPRPGRPASAVVPARGRPRDRHGHGGVVGPLTRRQAVPPPRMPTSTLRPSAAARTRTPRPAHPRTPRPAAPRRTRSMSMVSLPTRAQPRPVPLSGAQNLHPDPHNHMVGWGHASLLPTRRTMCTTSTPWRRPTRAATTSGGCSTALDPRPGRGGARPGLRAWDRPRRAGRRGRRTGRSVIGIDNDPVMVERSVERTRGLPDRRGTVGRRPPTAGSGRVRWTGPGPIACCSTWRIRGGP